MAIKFWQQAGSKASARKRRANRLYNGRMPRNKAQHIQWYQNSGIAMPYSLKNPPVIYSGHQARIMAVGYGYPKRLKY